MKKTLAVLALLLASLCAAAQTVPTTPNVGLYIPVHGQQNWDFYLNSNFILVDNLFSGGATIPNFVATKGTIGTMTVTNLSYPTGANFVDDTHGGVTLQSNNGTSGLTINQNSSVTTAFFNDASNTGATFVATDQASQCGALYGTPNGGWILKSSLTASTTYNMCGDTTGVYSGVFSTTALRMVPTTFATLPACAAGTEGKGASLTDSTTATQGATITGGGANHVDGYCNGTNWVVVSGSASGSTGISGATNNGAMYATSATTGTSTGALTDGQVLIGSSAGAPTAATLTAGAGITVTNAHNSITVAATGGTGFVGTNTQTVSYTAVAGDSGKLIIMNCSAACTFTQYGTPTAGYWNAVESIGGTLATVSLNSKNFNGASAVPVLNTFELIEFFSDGTNYFGKPPLAVATGMTLTPASNSVTNSTNASNPAFLNSRWYESAPGVNTLTTISVVNTTRVWAFVVNGPSVTGGHLGYFVGTADNSANIYDLGILDINGNLICHTGATAGTTFAPGTGSQRLATTASCTLLSGNRYYVAVTGNATTMALEGQSNTQGLLTPTGSAGQQISGTTSGGALNSSNTPPADSFATGGAIASITLYQ